MVEGRGRSKVCGLGRLLLHLVDWVGEEGVCKWHLNSCVLVWGPSLIAFNLLIPFLLFHNTYASLSMGMVLISVSVFIYDFFSS
jgi:hypothetical protein